MEGVKNVLAAVAGVVVVVLIIWMGYLGYWAIRGDSVNREVNIQNNNTGTQTAWRDEAHDKISDYTLLESDSPAAMRLKEDACELIGRLTNPYMDDQLVQFQESEC